MLEQEEKILNTDTLHFFLERTGSDMEHIYLEVQKLISYTHGRNVITPADVEAICTEQTENRIFDMVQAITEKDQKKALDLYSDLLAMKEPPMRILFLIARQFNQLLQLKSLSSQGMDRASLAKAAGIPSFALGKYQAQCRRFTLAQLRQAVEDCVQSEENVKTGRMGDQISVELLIMKYSSL
jgi:DNA polymerase-3 subunit delta